MGCIKLGLVCALGAPLVLAQRPGIGAGQMVFGNTAGPRPGFVHGRGFGRGSGTPFYGGFLPYGFGFYDDGYYHAPGEQPQAAGPPVVLVMPPAPQPVPYQPETAKPEIHEYRTTSAGAPAAFTVALKDGSVRYAEVLWVMDGRLHYITPEGEAGEAAVNSVDRARTGELNRPKNLQVWLPPTR